MGVQTHKKVSLYGRGYNLLATLRLGLASLRLGLDTLRLGLATLRLGLTSLRLGLDCIVFMHDSLI